MLSFTSAGLFDPNSELEFYEESKNGKYGYYEINDTDLWFFNNKQVKTIELLENDYSILSAWNIKEIETFRPTKLFDKTNYLDKEQKKDRSSAISSETHLYREWETKTRTISNSECLTYETSVNGTQSCLEYNSYEEEYEEWSNWKLYNFQIVKEGLYQTKTIVTRYNKNTGVVDWVDENEGWDLGEWATWWNTDWLFKRTITTLNGSISALYDITWVTGMKADFGDVRFLDFSTESIELNYSIIDKTDSSTAMFRVNNLNVSQIYMYYNNPSVSTTGSLNDIYFDPISGFIFDNANANDFNNINNGTIAGANFVSSGSIGGAYNFANDEIKFGQIHNTWPLTYSVRFNTDDVITAGFIVADEIGSNIFQASIWASGSKLRARMTGNSDLVGTTTLATGTWYTATLTVSAGGDTELYLDNNLEDSASGYTRTAGTVTDFLVGAFEAGVENNNFDGRIDEVYYFDRVISSSERINIVGQTQSSFVVGEEMIQTGSFTSLISPEDNQNILNNTVAFNFSSIPLETNLTNATLYIWHSNGTLFDTNFTTLSGNESVNTTLINTLEDGMYKWNAETCGESVNCSFAVSNNSFIVHVTPIAINISEPNGTLQFIKIGENETLIWTLTEPGENLTQHVTNCSYTYNSVITFLPINTCIVTNTTQFEYVLGINNLTFNTTDEFNLTSSQTTSWEYLFIEENSIFNENATETSRQDFEISITAISNILSIDSFLNYNGTIYTGETSCLSGSCNISTAIDIPLIPSGEQENKTFFWQISGFTEDQSFNFNSTQNNQTINRLHLEKCNATFTEQTLNFTAFDESTEDAVDPFMFDGAFDFWVGTGTITRNISLSESSVSSLQMCIVPTDETIRVDSTIEYDEASGTNYTSRNYFFQNDTINNVSQDIRLGLLLSEDSTSFILKVQDRDILPVSNVVIFTQRYYPGDDEFKTVQVSETDDTGRTVGFFKTETVDYRFILKQAGETVLITNKQKIVGEEVPFTLTFTIGEDAGSAWENFEDLDDFQSSLIYNKTTDVVSFSYADTSENFTSSRLIVSLVQYNSTSNIDVCDTTSTQSSAILSCNMTGNSTGTYIARSLITRVSTTSLIEQIQFQIEDITSASGRLGLLLGFFIILICAFMFKYNEIAGILMVDMAVIATNMMGLIAWGYGFISAIIAVSIIILVLLER